MVTRRGEWSFRRLAFLGPPAVLIVLALVATADTDQGAGPVRVTTAKLTITGGAPPAPKPPAVPITVSTARLTVTGGAPPAPKPPAAPIPVTTGKLTVTGKGGGG